jgi:hypothetical protein
MGTNLYFALQDRGETKRARCEAHFLHRLFPIATESP